MRDDDVYALTSICAAAYIKGVESVFEIIAEPNRRAILSLLVSSEQSVGEIERRASHAAADRLEAPARAARGRLRRSHRGRPAASLPAQTRTASGSGCLARAVPPVLVLSRGCARTPSRSHGINRHRKKNERQGENDDSSRTVRAWPGQRGAGEKDGEKWTLVLVRELRHPPDKVWQALTDPAQLREWAPFDADRSLGDGRRHGEAHHRRSATPHVSETTVTRADAPNLLEYNWGGYDMRWKLEAAGGGTRLTLWTNIDRRYISMGAAGWHVCSRRSGSPARRRPDRPHRWSRGA